MNKITASASVILITIVGSADLAQAADPAAGQAKAATLCAGCHGAQGEGKGDNPALKGQSETDLAKSMKAYKSGELKQATMNAVLKGVSDEDIQNLAAYYSSIK